MDYVEAMHLMLQQDKPDDFVIATGITTEIREFVGMACKEIGVEIEFSGSGQEEKGIVSKCTNPELKLNDGQVIVEVDPDYFRPTEVDLLIGDASKANEKLGWKPRYNLQELIKEMMASDLEIAKKEVLLKKEGYQIPNQHE
jgi:GDPmannose 4,6-dehydratase